MFVFQWAYTYKTKFDENMIKLNLIKKLYLKN